jgi:hypothetical protein
MSPVKNSLAIGEILRVNFPVDDAGRQAAEIISNWIKNPG